MKPLCRAIALACAVTGMGTAAFAQDPVLNTLDVQRLVAAETPVASLRLAIHFNALADRYFATADAHTAMGATYKATAHRSVALTAGEHCQQLATQARETATVARRLANYHIAFAAGRSAPLPGDAAALQGGLGAREPTADELRKLSRLARTRSDHLVLAEYYSTVAKRKAAESTDQHNRAQAYRAGVRKGFYDAEATAHRLARVAHLAALRAEQSASLHRQLANIA